MTEPSPAVTERACAELHRPFYGMRAYRRQLVAPLDADEVAQDVDLKAQAKPAHLLRGEEPCKRRCTIGPRNRASWPAGAE
jgi:hypothetical protein